MEKPIDFWLRKGKAVGETKLTENKHPSTLSQTVFELMYEGQAREKKKKEKEPKRKLCSV